MYNLYKLYVDYLFKMTIMGTVHGKSWTPNVSQSRLFFVNGRGCDFLKEKRQEKEEKNVSKVIKRCSDIPNFNISIWKCPLHQQKLKAN